MSATCDDDVRGHVRGCWAVPMSVSVSVSVSVAIAGHLQGLNDGLAAAALLRHDA